MKKKILLVAFNARYTHSNPAVYSLRTNLLDYDCVVNILEFTIHDDLFHVLSDINEIKPDVLGISVYIWNTQQVKLLLPEIKKIMPVVKILLGGPEVSYNAEEWLSQFPAIDYIVCGAGEMAIRKLAESDFTYPGKIIKITNPVFSELPFPYIPSDKEHLAYKYVYYEASRGCPFKCSYCLSSREDQVLQFRDMEIIKAELRQLWKFEPFIIKFIDRSFNVNQDFARQIWQFLIQESPDMMYHFEIHPLYLEEEDFDILKGFPQGRFQFEIGIQSIHTETLKEIGRTGDWDKIKPKLERLRKIKQIHQHYDALAGLPLENKEHLSKTVSELLTLRPDHLQLGFLKVLPGTEMAEKTHDYCMEFQSSPPYRIISTKWMTFEDIQSCENVETVLNSYINSEHFPNVVDDCFEIIKGKGFDNLEGFVSHTLSTRQDIKTKDWLKKAKILQSYYHKLYPCLTDSCDEHHRGKPFKTLSATQYDELLLWDWSIFPSNLPYPDFLPSHLLNEAKQESLIYFKQMPFENSFWSDNNVHPDDIRRAHFYKSSNPYVQEKVLQNHGYAMILKRQGKVKTVFYDIL